MSFSDDHDDVFATAPGSVVLAAQGQSPALREALENIRRTYWRPNFALFQRQGARRDEAEDLTQGCFALLLKRRDLNAVRSSRAVKSSLFLLVALCIFVLLAPSAGAIDPNPDVDKGTKPGDWIYQVVGANKDKWDIRSEKIPLTNYVVPFRGLSPGMVKILDTGIKQGQNWNPGDECEAAAVNKGWSGMNDSMFGGAGLAAILGGAELIQSIMGAQKVPSLAGQAYQKIEKKIKEALQDKAKDKIRELFKDVKPEVYISRSLWGGSLVILAIWDKAAGTYEIIAYGDCDCQKTKAFFSVKQPKKLKTFALRFTGTVSLALEGEDIEFKATGGSTAVHANCRCPSPGQPEPKEPPAKPEEPPAERPLPPIPPEDVTTKCKECQPIVDQIKAVYVDLKKSIRDGQEAEDFRLAAVKAGRKKEASEFKVQVLQAGLRRLQAERQLRDLAGQLAECEKGKCTPNTPGPTPGPEKTGPQGACPPCQDLEDQIKKIDEEIQKKHGEFENARRIWETEGPESDKGKKARSDYERLQKEIETLSKQANDLQEKLAGCIEEKCPPEGIDPCLIGTWECTSFKEAVSTVTAGGTGFRVTFKSDGTEIVDYSTMKPIKSGNDTTSYTGTATARISTKDGVAKIEKMENAGVTATLNSPGLGLNKSWQLPGLGAGGLGSTKDKNGYKCTQDTLEYQSSAARDEHANCTVKLTRVKEGK